MSEKWSFQSLKLRIDDAYLLWTELHRIKAQAIKLGMTGYDDPLLAFLLSHMEVDIMAAYELLCGLFGQAPRVQRDIGGPFRYPETMTEAELRMKLGNFVIACAAFEGELGKARRYLAEVKMAMPPGMKEAEKHFVFTLSQLKTFINAR